MNGHAFPIRVHFTEIDMLELIVLDFAWHNKLAKIQTRHPTPTLVSLLSCRKLPTRIRLVLDFLRVEIHFHIANFHHSTTAVIDFRFDAVFVLYTAKT